MRTLTISNEQLAEIDAYDGTSEVRDTTGRIFGYLISPEKYAGFLVAQEDADIAELERLALDPDVGTLQELWDELGIK